MHNKGTVLHTNNIEKEIHCFTALCHRCLITYIEPNLCSPVSLSPDFWKLISIIWLMSLLLLSASSSVGSMVITPYKYI